MGSVINPTLMRGQLDPNPVWRPPGGQGPVDLSGRLTPDVFPPRPGGLGIIPTGDGRGVQGLIQQVGGGGGPGYGLVQQGMAGMGTLQGGIGGGISPGMEGFRGYGDLRQGYQGPGNLSSIPMGDILGAYGQFIQQRMGGVNAAMQGALQQIQNNQNNRVPRLVESGQGVMAPQPPQSQQAQQPTAPAVPPTTAPPTQVAPPPVAPPPPVSPGVPGTGLNGDTAMGDLLKELTSEYQQALDSGNAANESRYKDILERYEKRTGEGIGSLRDSGRLEAVDIDARNTAIQQGYQDRWDRALGSAEGLGDQAREDVNRRYDQLAASQRQSLISRGLGNTTVVDTTTRGLESQRGEELRRLEEGLRREKIGYDTSLSGDALGFQERGAGALTNLSRDMRQQLLAWFLGTSGDTLRFMENRTDSGPNLANLMTLSKALGGGSL